MNKPYNEKLVEKICNNLPSHPLVKIKRPMGEIVTKVLGVVFEKGGPRLYLEDYPNICLSECMEDVEWVSTARDFDEGDELLKEKPSKYYIKSILQPNKIYKVIDGSFDDTEDRWIFKYDRFSGDAIMINGCISLRPNKFTGKLEADYMNNAFGRWGEVDGICSIKECNEAESTAFSYALDILYPTHLQEKVVWDDLIKEF